MFSNKESSGRHLLLDIRGITNIGVITDREAMLKLLDTICDQLKLNVLNKNHHQFSNGAITAVYMLTESHISIHTYPERNFVAMDLYSCKQYDTDDVLFQTAGFVISLLGGSVDSEFKIFNRKF